MKFLTTRLVNLYIFLFTVSMIAIALYMEHVMMLEPCPLCIMQRVFFIATGLVALAAFLHNPANKGQFRYGVASAVLAMAGGGFAIRQIYLQHLPPDEIPACLPSLGYMIEMDFDKSVIFKTLFSGDGNCAEVLWVDPIIGLGIPQWSLVGFLMLAGTCLWQGIRKA
jgi:disulfide bond formation protein DsbB